MFKRFLVLAVIALQTLKGNLLHTLLSTLGLVIGVAGLVAILSLGDGLEQYARDQISTTTSLEAIIVQPQTWQRVNGVNVQRDTIPRLQLPDAAAINAMLGNSASMALATRINTLVTVPGDTAKSGAYLDATQVSMFPMIQAELLSGRFFEDDAEVETPEVVLSYKLAHSLSGEAGPGSMLDRTISVGPFDARVVGILAGDESSPPMLYGAFAVWNTLWEEPPPSGMLLRANQVEEVPLIKAQVENWLDANVAAGSEAYSIITNKARVEQVQQGVRLFKIVMGLITGIAVLVGGIGVMNVLLISITERTKEIGIRKAIGAQRSDVVMQFLTESVTISFAGSLLGLGVGLATLAVALPIIRNVADAPFRMGFSWGSFGVVILVALLIGICFGTYPAWRAARLSPVDAIRHE